MHLRVRLVLVTLLNLVLVPTFASAQESRAATAASIERSRAALAPMAGLVGKWEGDAVTMRGPGQTMTVRQSEDITWGASGTVMIIRGTGRSPEGANKGQIIFEAAAIAWFDPDSNRVRMRTHNDGRSLEVELETRPDTLIWGFPVNGGRVRYTIAFGNDVFHEIGEFVRPGAPPVRTIEMTLKRLSR